MALAPWKVRVTADGSGALAAVHTTIELVDRAELPLGWAIGGEEYWWTGSNFEDPAGVFALDGSRLTTWLPADDTSDESESLTYVVGDGQGNLFWYYHYANANTDYWYQAYVAKTDAAGNVLWLTRFTTPLLGGDDPPGNVSYVAPLTDGGCQVMSSESNPGNDLFNVRLSSSGAIGTPYSRVGTTPQGWMLQVGSEVWFIGHSAGSGLLSRFDLDGDLISYEDAAPWSGVPNGAAWSGSRLAVATSTELRVTDGTPTSQWNVSTDGCRRAWFTADGDVIAGVLTGSQWSVQRRAGTDGSQVWSTDMPAAVECSVGTVGVVAVSDGDVFTLDAGSGAVVSQSAHQAGTVPTSGARGQIVAL
jgi:hypothetical protein